MDAVRTCDRLQSCKRFETRIAGDFVARHRVHLAGLLTGFRRRNFDRYDLRFEAMLGDRTGRPHLRFETETLGVEARDAVFGGDSLGAFELTGELVMVAILARDRLAVTGLRAGDSVGTDRQQTHIFDPAREHDVFGARCDHVRRQVDRKLTRTALRIDGGTRDVSRAAARQPRGADHVHRLCAHFVDTTADHLSHGG